MSLPISSSISILLSSHWYEFFAHILAGYITFSTITIVSTSDIELSATTRLVNTAFATTAVYSFQNGFRTHVSFTQKFVKSLKG